MGKFHSYILLVVLAATATPVCFAEEKLDTAPIVSALINVTKDADENVRYVAYRALTPQPRSAELLELFWRGLEDDSPKIRVLAFEQLVEFEGPTEKLLERIVVLPNDSNRAENFELGRRVQRYLVSIGEPAVPVLVEALKKNEASSFAISALGDIPLGVYRSTITKQLTASLRDENKSVRIAAIQSLQSILSAAAKSEANSQ